VNDPVKVWAVNFVYAWAYINLTLYLGYLLFWFLGWAEGIEGMSSGAIIATCLGLPLLSIFGLWARYEFDLIGMRDGTSAPSRFIWASLSLMLSATISYAYFKQMILLF